MTHKGLIWFANQSKEFKTADDQWKLTAAATQLKSVVLTFSGFLANDMAVILRGLI